MTTKATENGGRIRDGRSTRGQVTGADWDGAAFAPRTGPGGGPLPDPVARVETLALGERIRADRTVLNAEHFFDRRGLRLRVDAATAH